MEIDWSRFAPPLHNALSEDAVLNDVTTQTLIRKDWKAKASVVAKQKGIACGLPLAEYACSRFDTGLRFTPLLKDGSNIDPQSEIARIQGPAGKILSFERVLLNFLQKLSGVATLTSRYVDAVAGTGASILDTRKTTPGWRMLEKYAVRCGGGKNHRMDLGDQALIKENHLKLIADNLNLECNEAIPYALKSVKENAPGLFTVIELENLSQLKTALEEEPDAVLLDNFPPAEVRRAQECVEKTCGKDIKRPLVEVSGKINLANVRSYASLGVDRISIGALTHSAPALDISLDM